MIIGERVTWGKGRPYTLVKLMTDRETQFKHNRYRICCKTVNTNWMLVLSGAGSKRAQSYAIFCKNSGLPVKLHPNTSCKGCRNITVRPLFVLFRTLDIFQLFWLFSRHTWRRLHLFRNSSTFLSALMQLQTIKKWVISEKKMAA